MKKILTALAMVAMVVGLTGCLDILMADNNVYLATLQLHFKVFYFNSNL